MLDCPKVLGGANNIRSTKKINWGRFKDAGPIPVNVSLSKGGVHIIASRAFVYYATHSTTALKFFDWLKKARAPDEAYFSTLNNSPHLGVPGAYLGGPDSPGNPFLARVKNWAWMKEKCAGKFVRSICVFGVGDLKALASKKELFANKFFSGFEPVAYACMEELLCNRTRDELSGARVFNTSYYSQFDFIKNHVKL